jgi:tetratricopeptide (TPR) repeat protein
MLAARASSFVLAITVSGAFGATVSGGFTSARAQDATPVSVTTKEGRSGRVQVLGLKDGQAKLKVFAMDGEITITRPLDHFEPVSAFMIQVRATDPKTFEQHFELAKAAAKLDLLPQAGNQLREAAKAAGSGPDAEAKRNQAASWAADELERRINAAVGAGDLATADHCLDILTTRLPDQRTEDQIAKLTASVDQLRDAADAKKASERSAKRAASQQAALEKKLEPIRSKLAQGDKEYAKAVSQSKNTAASARACEAAVSQYKEAWKQAQDLTKASPDDIELQTEVAELSDAIVEHGLRAALHAANVLTLQSDYKSATDWVNRILKFDPDNEAAKEMLETIQVAQAAAGNRDDYRYGWRRRR